MNLLMMLYFVFVTPPVHTPQVTVKDAPILTSKKIVKCAKRPVEESSVYYHAPTQWVKISEKI